MLIRRANAEDLSALRKLSIDAFVKAYAPFNTAEDMQLYLNENFSEAQLEKGLNDPQLHYLVAYEQDEMVGYAKLDLATKLECDCTRPVEIARLYAHPEKIGKGIGAALMNAIEEFAVHNNSDAICLGVWQRNFKAINFYQREGFRICGLTQFRLGQDLQTDFIMMRRVK